jgi:hypothetical protein
MSYTDVGTQALNRLWSTAEVNRRLKRSRKSPRDTEYVSLYIGLQEKYQDGQISAQEFVERTNALSIDCCSCQEQVTKGLGWMAHLPKPEGFYGGSQ